MIRSRSLMVVSSLALGVTVAVGGLQACGSTVAPCDGCVDSEGRCAIGTDVTACGINGQDCRTCGQLDSCNLGVCVPPGGGGNQTDSGTQTDAGTQDAGTVDAGGNTDGGPQMDAGMDAGNVTDAGAPDASTEGVQCGSSVCLGTDVCCGNITDAGFDFMCAASCAMDAGVVISCDGPEDCTSAAGICCGELVTGPGSPPSCPVKSVTADCSATCAPNVPLQCDATAEIVRCHARADCSGFGSYSECCTYPSAGATAGYFCSTSFMAMYASNCAP